MSVQLLNLSDLCVDESLEGFVAANPGLVLLPDQRVVVDGGQLVSDGGKRKVALVSGGGSGHEPFCAGYVGKGMLGAAVSGSIFTSPPPSSVTSAISAVSNDNSRGVLAIVLNYTGDRVNFGLSAERCLAAGIKVEMYISGDDSALTQLEGTAGRRGLCGTLFLFKIVGALAESGASLEDALTTCKRLGEAIGTVGVAVTGCTLPGAPSPLFTVASGMVELGLGIHGEVGAKTIKASSAQEVVKSVLNHLTKEDSATRLHLQKGQDEVAVIVNNLGSTSQLEMNVLTNEVIKQLKERGVNPLRVYQGSLMTSIDMKGFHVSVLRLLDPQWISLLDAPTSAPAWPTPYMQQDHPTAQLKLPSLSLDLTQKQVNILYKLEETHHIEAFRACLEAVVNEVPRYEEKLNTLDAGCGDGDCGSTLVLGINALSKKIGELPLSHPSRVLACIGDIAATSMGGSSGGLYSILFTAAATHMASSTASHRLNWAGGLRVGIAAVSKYGGANRGDRTMLDALLPALEVLENVDDSQHLKAVLSLMAKAADEGAKQTAHMKARAGRASYVRAETVTGEDAGARAVALVFQALQNY